MPKPRLAPSVKFYNGHLFPAIGLGTWQAPPGEVGQAVKDAIDIGYRHIDCAALYGNEAEVGEAIAEKIRQGVVKREDLFVTSKLWNTSHRPDLVIPALKKSLEDLKLQYLDLYLIHWPFAFKEGDELFPKENGRMAPSDVDYVDTWKAMEEAVGQGLTRSIGVSNFNSKQLERLLKAAKIKPVTNQVECHPYLNQKKLIEFCKAHDIVVTAYSPLSNPSMTKQGEVPLMENPKAKLLGAKYGKSVAQIILRFLIQSGVVPIPKSVHRQRIEQNFDVFDFELSADDVRYIGTFNRNARVLPFVEAKHCKHYPFDEEF